MTGGEIVALVLLGLWTLAFIAAGIVATIIGGVLALGEQESEKGVRNKISEGLDKVKEQYQPTAADHLEPEDVRARAAFVVELIRALAALSQAMRPRSRSAGAFLAGALALILATVLGVATLPPLVQSEEGTAEGAADQAPAGESPSPTPAPGQASPTPSPTSAPGGASPTQSPASKNRTDGR